MPQTSLGLDEALITINGTNSNRSLDFYYQIDECYGCAMEKLKRLAWGSLDELVIGTKFRLNVELRETDNPRGLSCRLNNLDLNSHGHYQIDVVNSASSPIGPLECSIKTLDGGDCLLCPWALLLCFILLVTIGEKLYSKFVANRRMGSGGGGAKAAKGEDEESQGGQSSDRMTSGGGDGQQVATLAVDGNAGQQTTMSILQQQQQQQQEVDSDDNRLQRTTGGSGGRRVESLDAFRGLTIGGMIMVNYGGAGYRILEHKPWDGITLADFVFPFFIFSMGASIALSTRAMIKRGKPFGWTMVRILRRSCLLMALGLCLNSKWLPDNASLSQLRLTGVLQRFSLSYLVVATMYTIELTTNKWIKAQSLSRVPYITNVIGNIFELLTALNYLAIYIYVTFYLEYSATCPAGYLGPGGQTEAGQYANCTGGAAAWLDKLLLGESHLYNDLEVKHIFKTSVSHDPEGLLGYTTSILLTLIGLQGGKILVRFKLHRTRLLLFLQWMVILTVGCLAIVQIPINKRLWSFTFVTLTGACAYLILTLLYLLMDVYNCQRTFLLRLLVAAGKNSIFLYVAHSLLSGMLPWHFQVDQSSHLHLLVRLGWSTFVWLLVAHYMDSKGIYIKI